MAIHYQQVSTRRIDAPNHYLCDPLISEGESDIPTPEWMKIPDKYRSDDDGLTQKFVRESVYAIYAYMEQVLIESKPNLHRNILRSFRPLVGLLIKEKIRRVLIEFILLQKQPDDLPDAFRPGNHQPQGINLIDVSCRRQAGSGNDALISVWCHLTRLEAVATQIKPDYMRSLFEVAEMFGVRSISGHDVGCSDCDTGDHTSNQHFQSWRQRRRRVILWMIATNYRWLTDYDRLSPQDQPDRSIGQTETAIIEAHARFYDSGRHGSPVIGPGALVVRG